MRFWVTRLLLLAIGFSLIGPLLLAASAEDDLPACCRRDGKHRCAMRSSSATLSEAVLRAPQSRCPQCPNGSQSFAASKLDAAAPVLLTQAAELVSTLRDPAAEAQTAYRISDIRTAQKRGPPAVSL